VSALQINNDNPAGAGQGVSHRGTEHTEFIMMGTVLCGLCDSVRYSLGVAGLVCVRKSGVQ